MCPSPGEVCHSLYEFDLAIGVSYFIDILFGHFGEIHRKWPTLALLSIKYCYRLDMAKSEGPSIPNFMHQMLRVGHTEHTRTIIPKIGRTCE